jgi:hypothetical protein
MLVTMRDSVLINKLLRLANGDLDLVQEAIRNSAGTSNDGADLEKVVDYIVQHRQLQRVPQVA